MGWWKNAAGEVTGDDTADVVARDLDALAGLLGRRLTLAELLGYVHLVLAAKSRDLLAAETSLPPLVADIDVFGENEPVAKTVEMATADDPEIRQHVDAMCAKITQLYEAFRDRRPSLGEMLESIRFPLDSRVVELLGDADVRTIRVVATGGS